MRSYNQIESALKSRNLRTKLQHIENEPENRLTLPPFLLEITLSHLAGTEPDMRIFELSDNRA